MWRFLKREDVLGIVGEDRLSPGSDDNMLWLLKVKHFSLALSPLRILSLLIEIYTVHSLEAIIVLVHQILHRCCYIDAGIP